jgi:hypothetical protein
MGREKDNVKKKRKKRREREEKRVLTNWENCSLMKYGPN